MASNMIKMVKAKAGVSRNQKLIKASTTSTSRKIQRRGTTVPITYIKGGKATSGPTSVSEEKGKVGTNFVRQNLSVGQLIDAKLLMTTLGSDLSLAPEDFQKLVVDMFNLARQNNDWN